MKLVSSILGAAVSLLAVSVQPAWSNSSCNEFSYTLTAASPRADYGITIGACGAGQKGALFLHEVDSTSILKVCDGSSWLPVGSNAASSGQAGRPACDAAAKGTIYYDETADQFLGCTASGAWIALSQPVGEGAAAANPGTPASSAHHLAGGDLLTGYYYLTSGGTTNKVYMDPTVAEGGGWILVTNLAAADGYVDSNGDHMLGAQWLSGGDFGSVDDLDTTFRKATSLAEVVDSASEVAIQWSDSATGKTGTMVADLNGLWRTWLDGVNKVSSSATASSLTDSDGLSLTDFEVTLCRSLGGLAGGASYDVRSLGPNGGTTWPQFMGGSPVAPSDGRARGNCQCDFGPWESQMLLRGASSEGNSLFPGAGEINPSTRQSGATTSIRIFVRGSGRASSRLLGSDQNNVAMDCEAVMAAGRPSGHYNLYQDKRVWCENGMEGGGWIRTLACMAADNCVADNDNAPTVVKGWRRTLGDATSTTTSYLWNYAKGATALHEVARRFMLIAHKGAFHQGWEADYQSIAEEFIGFGGGATSTDATHFYAHGSEGGTFEQGITVSTTSNPGYRVRSWAPSGVVALQKSIFGATANPAAPNGSGDFGAWASQALIRDPSSQSFTPYPGNSPLTGGWGVFSVDMYGYVKK